VPLQFDTFYPWLDLAGLSVFAASGAELAAPWPALLAFVLGFLLRGASIRWKLTLPAHRGH
jgi:uncharacterized membrane protein YeiH